MRTYSLSHLSDPVLLRDLASLAAMDRATTALLLAHISEVDSRQLYLPAGHSSMFSYCVNELLFSEDAAYKRITAARIARRFAAVFPAVADGRLNLNSLVLLAPHLTAENADELLAAAANERRSGLERLIAERFPRPDLPTLITPLSPAPPPQLDALAIPNPVDAGPPLIPTEQNHAMELAARRVDLSSPVVASTPPPTPTPPVTLAPLSPERFGLQLTIAKTSHDKLRHAQALLRHQVPSGDVAQVLDRALDALIEKLEKRKFAATSNPRPRPSYKSTNARHIPAEVKREVWERDGGQCTYMSDSGRRCDERGFLEFDHMDPVALGGEASAERIRLRCRAHNQLEAEHVFGAEFMARKREEARRAKAKERSA